MKEEGIDDKEEVKKEKEEDEGEEVEEEEAPSLNVLQVPSQSR